ncbi:MAG: serpin family protein [Bacteroidales bacterium]|nr:serpin family protein [Bacteroidales bacterium]
MKKALVLLSLVIAISSCDILGNTSIKDPIKISSPEPTEFITKVSLTEPQREYVDAGNAFAFKFLQKVYANKQSNVIVSPLSLQYALAMVVNGASGQTASEITSALGFGDDVAALNKYCNLMLNQLPAVDENVKLKLTDAVIVNKDYLLKDSFRKTVEENYYAPVEYMDATNIQTVLDKINEWASRNTNGLIDPFLSNNDINKSIAATILNALYFKAEWQQIQGNPMFREENTKKSQPFYYDGGGAGVADYMNVSHHLNYGKFENNSILEIPYAGGNFVMYVLLPDEKGSNGLKKLLDELTIDKLETALSSMTKESKIHLSLPKFEIEEKDYLSVILQDMGISRSFQMNAEFDNMFANKDQHFFISEVIQKSKIIVNEGGTEVASVTGVTVRGANPAQLTKVIDFVADHPFVYCIAEKTSGAILFEGVFTGK